MPTMKNNKITNAKYHQIILIEHIIAPVIIIKNAIELDTLDTTSPPIKGAMFFCPTKKFKIITSIKPAIK